MKFKSTIRSIAATLLVCGCAAANAVPTTYNVFLSNSTDTLTGTITTDGVKGDLIASDFLGFSFTDVSTTGPGFTLSGTSVVCNFLANYLGCGFTVSRDGLALRFDNVPGDNNNADFFALGGTTTKFAIGDANKGAWVFSGGSNSKSVTFNPSGALLVGTVPEPETYAMFLSGLCLMGLIARRRRRS